jgi:hypothetical protein
MRLRDFIFLAVVALAILLVVARADGERRTALFAVVPYAESADVGWIASSVGSCPSVVTVAASARGEACASDRGPNDSMTG